MYQCRTCGKDFEPTSHQIRKHDYLCKQCQRDYWNKGRREGRWHGGMEDPQKKRDRMKVYDQRPEVKQRNAAQMRGYRNDPRLRERHLAREMVRNRIRTGLMQRALCEICGAPEAEAHHRDYARPFDVRWLCPEHHRDEHAAARAEPSTESSPEPS